MFHAQATVLIRRPVDQVFPVVADCEMSLQYWPGVVTIERTSGDDSGAGATYREVVKSGPVAMQVRFENTEFEPGRKLSFVTTRPRAVELRNLYTFEAVGTATRVTVTCQGVARGPLRALEPILERSVRLNHEESLGGLKRFLEAPRPAAG